MPPTGQSPSAEDIFALVIGIDKYIHISHLRGAVNDAVAFYNFLVRPCDQRGLGVPQDNICLLKNEDATRSEILAKFTSRFINNPKIKRERNPALIFFFAGHGVRAEAELRKDYPKNDREVEVICPVDLGPTDAGDYVHGIPDYVLVGLLKQLALQKGPNITVILDSCFSGGMGRKVGTERTPIGPVPFSPRTIPRNLDTELLGVFDKTSKIWSLSSDSHVLLAACRERQTAWELVYGSETRGHFTKNLIEVLEEHVVEKPTYEQIINHIPEWNGQNPHCGGSRRHQSIFGEKYPIGGRQAIDLLSDTAADGSVSYRVKMGSVEGVVPGTEFKFSMYTKDDRARVTLVAKTVKLNETILEHPDTNNSNVPMPQGARAKVSNWNNDAMILKVHTPADFGYKTALFESVQAERRNFMEVSPERAEIVLRNTRTKIVVQRLTSTIIECGLETHFTLYDPAHLPNVVNGITHFNYFLERNWGKRGHDDGSGRLAGFSLEMYHLHQRRPGDEKGNMVGTQGEVKFRAVKDAEYGFIIKNNSTHDLFPYLFYFNPIDYTIGCWYSPESKDVAPLRKANGEVRIGMGGEEPFEFKLPDQKTSSSGFLKLFVSTQYLNIEWIEQKLSPFDPNFGRTGRLDGGRKRVRSVAKWDTLTVKLTMTST